LGRHQQLAPDVLAAAHHRRGIEPRRGASHNFFSLWFKHLALSAFLV
jgi:hypothetical protein